MMMFDYQDRLAIPPRDISFLLMLRIYFGGIFSQFGWIFFGFGLTFVWAFGVPENITSRFMFLGELERGDGMVTASREANASEGDVEIYEIRYVYEVDEETYYGKAYATGEYLEEGTPVIVEYAMRNPAISRIQGMRTSMFGPFVIVTLIFPLIGLIFIARTVHKGRKAHRLLQHGRMTRGTLISKESTNVRVNRRPVYKLVFEFEDDGETYHTTAKTHLPEELEDEALEQLLYDPDNPSYAVMLDELPVSPNIDTSGNFALPAREILRTFLQLLIPAISLIGHGMYIYLKYSQ